QKLPKNVLRVVEALGDTVVPDDDAWAEKLREWGIVKKRHVKIVTEGALLRLADLKAEWSERQVELQAIKTGYIDVINEWARIQNVPHVASPGQ
ncbi:MAG: hypothetical protein V3R56_09695, partial [Xanthomonadales bacterium]